jgi:thiamine-phosphate pyrophosphorylase
VLLDYITDRTQFSGDEASRRRQLLDRIAEAARSGVDFIQLREKDLSICDLESLAREAVERIRLETGNRKLETGFLINSRTDVAIAIGAAGVHLRSDDISPADVRAIWPPSGRRPTIGVSCHSDSDVARAAAEGADFAVFAPVFEKHDAPAVAPAGIESLRQACRHKVPVLALGGVTLANARDCLDAGAAGVAGIRLFQQGDLESTVRRLRTL